MTDEAALLAALQASPNDDLPRLVYADWLDDHNRAGGAYLRAECEYTKLAADDGWRIGAWIKLRKASAGLTPAWLAAVGRVPIENCDMVFEFQCPKRWEHLTPTAKENVRHCEECRQSVFFCGTMLEAQTYAARGECVALDPRLTRTPGDISQFQSRRVMLGMMIPGPPPEPEEEPTHRPRRKRRRGKRQE